MSATGLDVFDKTLQTTNIWLDQIMADTGPDRQTAWRVLAVVLHRLRNRLPIGLAANLGAQLPLLVRGLYYDQFEPAALPSECDTMEQFCAEVAEWLQDNRPVDPETAVKSVFGVLSNHVSKGEIGNVVQALPESIRQAWPSEARNQAQQQMKQSASAQQSGQSKAGVSRGKEGVTQWGSPDVQPGNAGDTPAIGRGGSSGTGSSSSAGQKDPEPATADSRQNMVGGTGGQGPAR